MLTFANPWLLLLLPLVPLVIWRWRRRSRPALRHPQVGLLASLPSGRSKWVERCGIGARAAALTLLAVALAGPRLPDLATRIPTEGISIAILVDVSGSMDQKDFDWRGEPIARLDAVKRAFRLFVSGGQGPDGQELKGRAGDLVSLVVFATRPETVCPLTLSYGVLLQELDKQEPRMDVSEATTNITDAIIEGLDRLRKAGTRRRVIVLLSDGEDNVAAPSGFTPRQAAQIAGSLGIPIYAIDAGNDLVSKRERPSADAEKHREVGLRTLREVARITGGECFPAHDTTQLLDVCSKIDRLERARIDSYQYRLYREGFPWLGLAALFALLGIIGLESTVWQRVLMTSAALDRWFAQPDALALLLLLPVLTVLAIWAARRQRRVLMRLGRLAALAAVTQRRRRWLGLRRFCTSLALSILVIGSAGPQWGREPSVAVAHGRDLVIVLDLSRSMLADDVLPGRFAHARQAVAELLASLQQRGGHRVALVAFAGRARTVCPLTHDYDHFLERLRELDADHLVPELRAGPESASGTRIGAALELAVDAHDARFHDTHVQDIVLLSDGDDPADDKEWFHGIPLAQKANIPVHTIGIGDPSKDADVPGMQFQGKPVRTRLMEKPLKEIAEQTRGTYTPAGTGRVGLVELFRNTLEPGRKRAAQDEAPPVYHQRYVWFFAAALLLLTLEMSLGATRAKMSLAAPSSKIQATKPKQIENVKDQ